MTKRSKRCIAVSEQEIRVKKSYKIRREVHSSATARVRQ